MAQVLNVTIIESLLCKIMVVDCYVHQRGTLYLEVRCGMSTSLYLLFGPRFLL